MADDQQATRRWANQPDDQLSPLPGELDIREPLTFRPWQVASLGALTLLAGMYVGHCGAGTGNARAAQAVYTPPPPAASGAQTTTSAEPDASTSSSSVAAASPPTTATSGPTGQLQVLLPKTQASGSGRTASFTAAPGGWNIGWAFRCQLPPGAASSFEILIAQGSQTNASSAVDQSAPSGQGVAPEGDSGTFELVIRTLPACTWAVKVTGPGPAH